MFTSFKENMNIADATFVEFKVSISIRILSAYMRYEHFTIYIYAAGVLFNVVNQYNQTKDMHAKGK